MTNDEELLAAHRRLAAINESMAAVLLAALRVLARDVLQIVNVAPGDPLRPLIVGGARQRAEKVLAALGDDQLAN